MQLRQYQQELIEKIHFAWENGAQNVLLQLSTGGGKTCLFCKVIADTSVPVVAIAHRIELVSQISLTLARYGIRHRIIAQKPMVRSIISIHMLELNRSFYDPQARVTVIGVDTLVKLGAETPWIKKIKLVVQDEAHHVLRSNKWGIAAALFPSARGLYPTATPVRADGYGLGRHADGIIDAMVVGRSMRELITDGYLTEYRIFAPPSDLDLSEVPLSASGDYSPPKLRTAVHKSHITGDVVSHYLKISPGKLGVTFAVDVEAATEIAAEFRANGVPAEVVSSKTPDLLRANIMRRFRNREILQLVNVDLLGEGVDVPAIEVVSFARPTQSYGLFVQQFGRALRPLPGKTHAIIIDHVGNVLRHGLPDARRTWSLDRRERKSRAMVTDGVPLRVCLNENCLQVYPRIYRLCPHCGYYPAPSVRSRPEEVDGDLQELDPETLARLRGEIDRIDNAPRIPGHLDPIAQRGIANRHHERQEAQKNLREIVAVWAGYYKAQGYDDSAIYRQFYFNFNVDIATAQTLGAPDAKSLKEKISMRIAEIGKMG